MKQKLLRLISVRIPEDLLQRIDAKCEASSISRSNLFRTALEGEFQRDTTKGSSQNSIRDSADHLSGKQ